MHPPPAEKLRTRLSCIKIRLILIRSVSSTSLSISSVEGHGYREPDLLWGGDLALSLPISKQKNRAGQFSLSRPILPYIALTCPIFPYLAPHDMASNFPYLALARFSRLISLREGEPDTTPPQSIGLEPET